MTSLYDTEGNLLGCTVLEAGPCVVTHVKTIEKDGYNAVQLAYGERGEKNATSAAIGHFKKAGTTPKVKSHEFKEFTEELKLGDKVDTDIFLEGGFVTVTSASKGKGFQGVVKRHGFGGVMQQTHGQHNRLRAPGSLGNSSFAAKVMKGMRMGGHMGVDRIKVRRLQVIKIFPDQNLILVKGAIPGHKGSYVVIEK